MKIIKWAESCGIGSLLSGTGPWRESYKTDFFARLFLNSRQTVKSLRLLESIKVHEFSTVRKEKENGEQSIG